MYHLVGLIHFTIQGEQLVWVFIHARALLFMQLLLVREN